MNKFLNISLVQADLVWENPQESLNKFDKLLQEIPKDTEVIVIPEMFDTGFTMNVQKIPKPVGSKTLQWLKNKTSELNKIITGSILTEDHGKYYNRMYWMRPDGSYDYYDKRHLFHMGNEHKIMTAGKQKTIVAYKDIKIQLQICYDLRFPVWSKNNYDKKTDTYDFDVIIYIANWPESRKQAYLNLLKARAIENQAFVIWVNRVGMDGNNVMHSGDSQIVDPQGNILLKLNEKQEQIASFQIDFSILEDLRNNFKVGLDWDKFKIFV